MEYGRTTKKRHWGMFTLGFLIMVFAALVFSTAQHGYTIWTLTLLVVGFVGAGWTSVRGLRQGPPTPGSRAAARARAKARKDA